jgi:hypothetical protein
MKVASAVGGALILAIAASFSLFYATSRHATAEEIVAQCTKEESSEKCYEREVPKLYPALTMSEIFTVIRDIRAQDPAYQFCHVLAHKIGENASAEDPSRWIDLIPHNPADGLCSNGFIHGVIVGRFRNDTLDAATLEKTIPDFQRACEPRSDWSPSPLDQAICYHGMGHLFMFITNADIRTSLDTCNRVAKSATGDFLRVCREGVFMQIYQPLEPDDFALIELLPEKPTADNYRRQCASYGRTPEEQGACLREAWPLFRKDILSGKGATSFCSGQPNAGETNACYDTISAIIGRMSLGDADKAVNACESVPEEREITCFAAAAQAIIEEDRTRVAAGIQLCGHAKASVARGCLERIASMARFLYADSQGRANFCAQFPKDVQARCN